MKREIPTLLEPERFTSKIQITESCWLWTRYIDPEGYGRYSINDVKHYAHRVSYTFYVGKISEGKVIDHVCRVKNCVNPEHLRMVDVTTNTLENSRAPAALNKLKSSCKYGHSLEGSNLIVTPKGTRACRSCRRTKSLKAYYSRAGK